MHTQQSLEELIPQKSAAELTALLPPWAYQFKRLLLDPAKAVRIKAAGVMAAVGAAVGKGLLPHVRALLGPWYLACFDPYPDAAGAAKRALAEVFPGRKQADALAYCRRAASRACWRVQLAPAWPRSPAAAHTTTTTTRDAATTTTTTHAMRHSTGPRCWSTLRAAWRPHRRALATPQRTHRRSCRSGTSA